jgi:hypothetical protein
MKSHDSKSVIESANVPAQLPGIRRPCNASDSFCYCAGVGGDHFRGPCLIYSNVLERNR